MRIAVFERSLQFKRKCCGPERKTAPELRWLSAGKVGILSELLRAVSCTSCAQRYAHNEQFLNLGLVIGLD